MPRNLEGKKCRGTVNVLLSSVEHRSVICKGLGLDCCKDMVVACGIVNRKALWATVKVLGGAIAFQRAADSFLLSPSGSFS